jgi:hypothetical protein
MILIITNIATTFLSNPKKAKALLLAKDNKSFINLVNK